MLFCSSSHLTSEYRAASKENRELTHRLETLKEQRARSVCLLEILVPYKECHIRSAIYFSFNMTVDNVAASLTSPETEAVKRKARIAKVRFPCLDGTHNTHIHTCTHMHTCTHVHTYTYVHTYTHVHMYTHMLVLMWGNGVFS